MDFRNAADLSEALKHVVDELNEDVPKLLALARQLEDLQAEQLSPAEKVLLDGCVVLETCTMRLVSVALALSQVVHVHGPTDLLPRQPELPKSS